MSIEITANGYIKVMKPDGTQLSQHSQLKEAYESAINASLVTGGTYTIVQPNQTVVAKLSIPPVEPPVDPPANQPPVIALTSPTDGATFASPSNITVTAVATDPDGTVVSVEFFAGNTSLGTDTSSPYSVVINDAIEGDYVLTAVAKDDDGAIVGSASRTVRVVAVPPVDPPTGDNPFDGLYPANFRLPDSAVVAIPTPGALPKVSSLAAGAVVGPFNTRVYRASTIAEGIRNQNRHNYSRRQAFNCDNTYYITVDGDGSWHLYDANTFVKIKRIPFLGGGCEPLWHATDPKIIHHTANYGGKVWKASNVDTGASVNLFDFTGQTPWPEADSFWTRHEGSASANGRRLCLMASRKYQSSSVQERAYGLVTLDTVTKQIISQAPLTVIPDHLSTSPSGRWCVVSGSTTYALPADNLGGTPRQLHDRSEHSDLCVGPEGDDYYVFAAYSGVDDGWIVAVNIDTGARFRLAQIYGASASFMSVHISGQAFDKPGWIVVSSYADASNYGNQVPSSVLTPLMRKVTLHELKPNGRHLDVAFVHANINAGDRYFREPQATASRDLSRIMFASNYGAAQEATSFMIGLPSVF